VGGNTAQIGGPANLTIGGRVQNASLAKFGSGTVTLAGSDTYIGPTTINQGKLVVNGSLVSAVTVNSGGILGGTGSLGSVTVNSGGILAPGNSPGTLNLSGSLVLSQGAYMDYELDTPSNSDLINMPAGLLTLNNQQFSDFQFTPLANFSTGTYLLIDAGAISGALGDNVSGPIGNGFTGTLAIQGNNLVLNVVPEPGTMALLGACVVGLIGSTRSNKAKIGRRVCLA
jgi:autotransporter-associated beta strand protein